MSAEHGGPAALLERSRVQPLSAEAWRIGWDLIADAVSTELQRQREKWGIQDNHPDYWFVIASEEIGEVAKALCERNGTEARSEIVQAIAVLAQLWAAIDTSRVMRGGA